MPSEEIWLGVIATGTIMVVFLIALHMRNKAKSRNYKTIAKEEEKNEEKAPTFKVKRSVSTEEASKAKNELRILNLEREITSYALTRLYEAEAEGKIGEDERKRLLESYKRKMDDLERQINNYQLLSGLYELEATQEELVKTFYGKFSEINKRVEELRVKLGIVSKEEGMKPSKLPEEKKEEAKVAPSKIRHEEVKPKRTSAEERIEQIREEVLKVLERLEQIETEA